MGSLFSRGGSRPGEGIARSRTLVSAGVATTLDDKAVEGSGSAPAGSGLETEQQSYFLNVRHGLGDKWFVDLTLPARFLEVYNPPPVDVKVRSDGVGDLQLRATYRLLASRGLRSPEVQVGLGLSVPTGSTDETSSAGNVVEDPVQPGRGTIDPLLNVTLFYPLDKHWYAYASAGARLGVEANDNDYEFGNSLQTVIGGAYSARRVDVSAQLTWTHTERDHTGGDLVTPTGGDVLYLVPGIQVWATNRLSVRLEDQFLLAHSVNGKQMLAAQTLTAVVIVQF